MIRASQCEPHFKDLNMFVSTISLLASGVMTLLCIKNLHYGAPILLILGIACSDFVYSFANVISLIDQHSDPICYTEAIIKEWSFNFSLIFVVALSISCYQSSKGRNPNQVKYFWNVIIVGTIFCLILSILLIWLKDYIQVVRFNFYCIISASDFISFPQKLLVRTIYEGLPSLLGLATATICYCRSSNSIVARNRRRNSAYGYIIVMCLILLPAMIDNYLRIGKDCDNQFLLALHLLFPHSAGTLNACVYGYQQYIGMRDRQNALLGQLIPYQARNEVI